MYKDKHERTVEMYLDDVADAIRRIRRYTKGMSYEKFVKDDLVFDAVMKNFLVIGEAINYIPDQFRKNNKDIPWREIVGMRNRIIHEYFAINKETVWETKERDLPFLVKEIKKLKSRV